MRERACQAEIHVPDCPCPRCRRPNCDNCQDATDDHFTSKGIAKILGWKHKQINSYENRQWLSRPCHRAKDKNVPQEMEVLRRQQRGAYIPIGGHARIGYNGEK